MIIKSFEIKSYRSCIRTKFSLQPKLTGLIGINGAGKSNILNAIVLFKKMYRSRPPTRHTDSSSRNTCQVALEIEHENKTLFIRGDVAYETDEHNFDEIYVSRLKFNFREFTNQSKWIELPIQFLGSSSNEFRVDPFRLDIQQSYMLRRFPFRAYELIYKSKEIQKLLSEVAILFDGINYYSASQFSDPSQCPVYFELEEGRPLRRFGSGIGRMGHGMGRGMSHEQFILDLYQSQKAKNTQYKRYLNTVGAEGIELVDNIQFLEMEVPSSHYTVETGGKISKIERTKLLVVPRFTVNNTELSPNQLSEGTFKTLALIFYILTDDSKLLLIEEPEVCVHHGLLNSVISLILTQSKKKQIIMSTHSDFVLDHLDPENLLLVRYLAEKGTIAKPLSKLMSTNDYKALHVYLEESGNLGEYWKEGGFIDE